MSGNRVETTISQVSAALTDENHADMEDAASLEFRDWLTLGDKASLALAHGLIDQDEAQTLYRIHGESHDHYKRQPLERRLAYVLWITPLVSAMVDPINNASAIVGDSPRASSRSDTSRSGA